ncbi:MAG: Z1 domain-containing protein [Dehalococcoidia bacterium]
MFDINRFKNLTPESNRYGRRIDTLRSRGKNPQHIQRTVEEAIGNLESGATSFVIYGEPQSGKTEMMVALTARLLDEGHRTIVILVNDNIPLLTQNLKRFQETDIDPTPVDVKYALDEKIGEDRCIIFSKKNANDLKKLNEKLRSKRDVVVIDDEADFASPNSKINLDERSRINEEINKLLAKEGTYIGVTATPARLDLNNTFDNVSKNWLCFEPHEYYVGKNEFFPMDLSKPLGFALVLLEDTGDDPKHLRDALLRFLVNVGYVNVDETMKRKMGSPDTEGVKCCFLVHTSGETDAHQRDKEIVASVLRALADINDRRRDRYIEALWETARCKYGEELANRIVDFVLSHMGRKFVEVMNTQKKSGMDTTEPPALFTIIIGGNIVSRGITINNLLGMFFTRDAKHRIQQDTYIQRARMFGNRKDYLHLFELSIPKTLYTDWHRCFVYHHLSLQAIKSNKGAPIWIADKRITPAASGSIDKRAVVLTKNELLFGLFDYTEDIERIVNDSRLSGLEKLEVLNKQFGDDVLPKYVIDFIHMNTRPHEGYVFIHGIRRVGQSDTDYHSNLIRQKGVFGGREIKEHPEAIHHILILRNPDNEARIVYWYRDDIRFYENLKPKSNV